MTIEQMRNYISDAYPGKAWKFRVSRMRENQVIAIYKSLISRDTKDDKPKVEEGSHQIDIFEYMQTLN